MKILAITDSYPPHHSGGYELRCKNIFEGLRSRGHELFIITTRCPTPNCGLHDAEKFISRVLHKKSETPSISSRIYHDLIDMKFVRRMERKYKPDIIHLSHLGDLSNAIFFYFSKRNLPIVFDDGGLGMVYIAKILKRGIYFYKNGRDKRIKKKAKILADQAIHIFSCGLIPKELSWPQDLRIIFNSQCSMNFAEENGVPMEEARVISSGVDVSVFSYKNPDGINDPIRIIVPGRIEEQKGIRDAIYLLSFLKERNIQAKLTIIGPTASPSFFNEMVSEIRDRSLEKYIQILPMANHQQLAMQYRASDVCFFPSYQETGLSRVPLEAMSSGCLVITYGNEGSNEIIKNGETGYVVKQGNVASVASLIEEIIHDPTNYWEIIYAARSIIERNYSLDAYLDRIEEFIVSSVIKPPSQGTI